ncbi:MAG: alpha-ribazole phosphatase family protein [Pararhodobacter sp.]
MALILLRHTRPEGAEGLCYGRSDLPLAACFPAEAARLARELPPFGSVFSSPLSRCRRLAEVMAQARGVPLALDQRLIEMDFGTWEGQRWEAIARAELDAWAADLEGARPHGGESVATLARRAREGLRAAQAATPDAAQGAALVVTHAGVIKAALAARDGLRGWRTEIGFGAWLELGSGWERSDG